MSDINIFEKITAKTHKYVDDHIGKLRRYCAEDADIAEFVRYIIAYSDDPELHSDNLESNIDERIGRELISFIYDITGIDLSDIGNSFHFDPGWAKHLNYFIGNWFQDDSGFQIDEEETRDYRFAFRSASNEGAWLQDPRVLIEAAKANIEAQNHLFFTSKESILERAKYGKPKLDRSKVDALIKERM